jgi:predicted ABC-type ATPase
VRNRTYRGEHNVPEEKIINRYYKSLDLLADAFKIVDRAFILDSSNKNRDVILEKEGNQIFVRNELVPEWIEEYLINRLKLSSL